MAPTNNRSIRSGFCSYRWLVFLLGFIGAFAIGQAPQEELNQLKEQMGKLQQELDAELSQKDEAVSQLATLERQIGGLHQSLQKTEHALSSVRQKIATLKEDRAELANQTKALLADFTALLIRGYPVTAHSTLKTLLDQQDPHIVARRLHYHRLLTQSSASTLTALAQQIESIAINEKALAAEQQTLNALAGDQQQQLKKLDSLAAKRAQQVSAIEQRILDNKTALETLKADEQRLERVVEMASRQSVEALDTPSPIQLAAQKGKLPMPANGTVRIAFGNPRPGSDPWRGWMLETQEKATVHAVGPGRVVYANWLRGYGLLLILDHQDDLLTLYAHNDALFFDVGDWVRQGEVVALAGRPTITGATLDQGTYFELRQAGQPKDPALWIDRSLLP